MSSIVFVNLKINGQRERQQHLFGIKKRIAVCDAPSQAEAQIVFLLGDKDKGYLREGEQLRQRKAFLLVQKS